MVKSAVHHDANIIFGAAIDENMDDEIRVIVIATGFDEGAILHDDVSLFSGSAAAAPKPQVSPEQPADSAPFPAAGPAKEEPPEEDPFESIFRIFNKK